MKNWKRLIVLTLVIVCTIICASCKSCSDPKDNKEVPAISNPNDVFLQIDNYKVSNNKAYYQLLNSYGVETLINIVDDALLPAVDSEDNFNKYLDKIIYGEEEKTAEEKAEALEEFLKSLPLSGLSNDKNAENYYVNYYRLAYRKNLYAKSVLKEEIKAHDAKEENKENPYYSKEVKEAYFESLYRKNTEAIIIRFDSQKEANYYLENVAKVNLNNVNNGWVSGETKLTNEQVKAKFEEMYKAVNNTTESGVKTYTYDELLKVSSALANAIYNWDADKYTRVATKYNDYVYLAYKVSETGNLENGKEVTYEAKENDVIEALIDGEVTSTYAAKASIELAAKNGLKIYDRGLEIFYKLTYDSIYTNLGYAADAYTAFQATSDSSNKNVFSFQANGQTVEVSADQFFNKLTTWYGEFLAATYIKQYIVLQNNGVYDLASGTIKDQTKYDEYYKTDIQEYKDAFGKDEYASLGYPSTYGWEAFIRDYLGIIDEKDIIVNIDSTLYADKLEEFKKTLYLGEEEKDEDGKVIKTIDQKIQDKMVEIYFAYFDVTAVGITAYYDKDLDGEADEIDSDSPAAMLRHDLVKAVYNKVAAMLAADDNETVSTALADIVLEYKLANGTAEGEWKEYKNAGLELKIADSSSYTHDSAKDDAILNQLRTQYNRFLGFKNKTQDGTTDIIGKDLSGVSLVSTYRYTLADSDTVYTVRPTDSDFMFTNGADDIVTVENVDYCYIITKITKKPVMEGENYTPTYAQYLKYLDNEKLSTAVKNCITKYYIPAIEEFANNDLVNNALVNASLATENNGLFTKITFANKESLKAYIQACIIEDTEE